MNLTRESAICGRTDSGKARAIINDAEITSKVERLKAGYTRLPNEILMQIIHGDLSKAEIKTLLLIARFTISYKDQSTGKERQFAPLSKGTICLYTRVQGKGILHALHCLEDRGLIRKVQGDHCSENQFGLVYTDGLFQRPSENSSAPVSVNFEETKNTPPETLMTRPEIRTEILKATEISEIQTMPLDIKRPWDQKCTQGEDQKSTYPQDQKGAQEGDQKSTHYKQYELNNNINHILNTPLTSEDPGVAIVDGYFRSIPLEMKRESEWLKYLSLKKRYSPEQVATGLNYLLNHGIPGKGVMCHSPMAYLAVAIPSVLQADLTRSSSGSAENTERSENFRQFQEADPENLERVGGKPETRSESTGPTAENDWPEDNYSEKLEEFQCAFPSDRAQEKYLADFVERYPFFQYYKNPKRMAVMLWHSESQQTICA